MKIFLVFVMLIQMLFYNDVEALADNSNAAILIDGNSEEILFEKNSEEKRYPASTTKIMTLILIYEALNNGSLHLNDMITASSYASSMGGSQIYLKEGESMSVEDLLKSVILSSANDSCVAFSEYLGGTSEAFVQQMNEKAKTLKLKNTHFVNCTGLHDEDHYTCAYDLAIMAKYLLEIGGDHLLQYTTLKEDYIRDGEFWLVNTNKLLSQSDMITGLKTGYTKEAGYCLVSTATKNGQTMISVLLNEPKAKTRNEEALALLNYGFSLYKSHTLFEAGDVIQSIELPLTKEKSVDLITNDTISISLKKDVETIPNYEVKLLNKESFQKGEHIANLTCNQQTFPLYAASDGTPLNFMERVYEIWLKML